MIFIIGCDHGHQRKAQSCGGYGIEAFEREQKAKFVEAVEKAVQNNQPALIGEEIEQNADTCPASVGNGESVRPLR